MLLDDDAARLSAARKLDRAALVAIFDAYAPVIYKYVLRLCGDCAEADDIVGEVFAQLLKQLKEGKGPRDNLRSYLYQIAYHKVVDQARDEKHLAELDDGLSSGGVDSLHLQNEQQEQMEAIQAIILERLSEDQRHVISLRFIENFSIKETAEIVGKNVSNVKVIQNRALGKLRRLMDRQTEEAG